MFNAGALRKAKFTVIFFLRNIFYEVQCYIKGIYISIVDEKRQAVVLVLLDVQLSD